MGQKQGGKGKQSSQSDKNYWARIKLTGTEARKARRAARHCRRMGKSYAQLSNCGAFLPNPTFPRIPIPREKSRVVLSTNAAPDLYGVTDKNPEGFPIFIALVAGALIEVSRNMSDTIRALTEATPRLEKIHLRQFPSGRRELISAQSQT